ncbi:MAG TPA: glycosyltransferase [Candidatus Omnitrophota bacterium]|nr:glycosyltransferase [Candidatus Omnitrophota bacterium]
MKAQIVILNYKGETLLPQCLPSIVDAANQSSCPCRVVVLNNPSDGPDGLDYVRREYPQVEIVQAPQNKVLCSYNDFLKSSNEDVSILLNNDIRVDAGFVDALVKAFESDPRLFLAAPKTMSFDGKTVEAADSRAEIRFGLFWCSARYPGYEANINRRGPTFSSGFGAFRVSLFNGLGGYDERYLPGIFEDVDLCLRAKRAGYELVYEPSSVVYHMGQASFKEAFKQRGIEVLASRNQFLFLWKNYSGPAFWFSHLFWLPLRFVFDALRGRTSLWEGFWQALAYIRR